MSDDYGELTDFDGRHIEIGTRVRVWDYLPGDPHYGNHRMYHGTVTDLGEWDGDHDDEGRSIQIPPYVTVIWDDEDKMKFPTSEWEFEYSRTADWPEIVPARGKVEELAVIGPPDVGQSS